MVSRFHLPRASPGGRFERKMRDAKMSQNAFGNKKNALWRPIKGNCCVFYTGFYWFCVRSRFRLLRAYRVLFFVFITFLCPKANAQNLLLLKHALGLMFLFDGFGEHANIS